MAMLAVLLVVGVDATMKWSASEAPKNLQRRLGTQLASSTKQLDSENCFVGGFDTDHPEKVYVGGPCSLLDVTTDANGQIQANPKQGFRHMSMQVIHGGISNKQGSEVELKEVPNSAFYHALDSDAYLKVGTTAHLKVGDYQAMMIAGQTSYLAKSKGTFKKNAFAFNRNADNSIDEVNLCVTACCTPQNGQPCACTDTGPGVCSGSDIPITVGQYKFSVFAASIDSSTAMAGSDGDGWARLVEDHGVAENGTKRVQGNFFVDQVLDFTGMAADTLTVVKPDSSRVNYADMVNMVAYEVKSMQVQSNTWSASYAFPLTYTAGDWDNNNNIRTLGVGNVKINVLKVSANDLVKLGVAASLSAAQSMKVIYLRYAFDISGISGTQTSGNWFAYDPVISNGASGSNTLESSDHCRRSMLPSVAMLFVWMFASTAW